MSVGRALLFIRVGVGITCGAAASHGRGHLTPSPPNSWRSDSRFFFIVLVFVCLCLFVSEGSSVLCVRCFLSFGFALSSLALRLRCLQDTPAQSAFLIIVCVKSFLLLHRMHRFIVVVFVVVVVGGGGGGIVCNPVGRHAWCVSLQHPLFASTQKHLRIFPASGFFFLVFFLGFFFLVLGFFFLVLGFFFLMLIHV
jgi:hypothetical protein